MGCFKSKLDVEASNFHFMYFILTQHNHIALEPLNQLNIHAINSLKTEN